MTNAKDYKRFMVETFASREGLLNYVDRLAKAQVKQFTVQLRSDGLWEVCYPISVGKVAA